MSARPVRLIVSQPIPNTFDISIGGMSLDMMEGSGCTCSLTYSHKMMDELQQWSCRHTKPTPPIALLFVSMDGLNSRLAVCMYIQRHTSWYHYHSSRNRLKLGSIDTMCACDDSHGPCRCECYMYMMEGTDGIMIIDDIRTMAKKRSRYFHAPLD